MRINLDGTAIARVQGVEIGFGPLTESEKAAYAAGKDREFEERSWRGYRVKDDTGGTTVPGFVPETDPARLAQMKALSDKFKSALEESANKTIDEKVKALTEAVTADIAKQFETFDEKAANLIADRVKAALEQLPFGKSNRNAIKYVDRSAVDGKSGKWGSIELPRRKYTLDTEGIDGGRQDALDAWVALVAGNPLRDLVMIIPMSGGSATLPSVGSIPFRRAGAMPEGGYAQVAGDGALNSVDLVLQQFVSGTFITNASANDVPGFREAIAEEMMQEWGTTEGRLLIAAAKASVVAAGDSFASVTSGVQDGLPAAENIIPKMADLIAAVEAPYHMGATFQIARPTHGRLMAAAPAGGGYAFDASMGVRQIEGYDVRLNDHIDSPADGAVMGYFGNFRRGLILGEGTPLTIADEYTETRPGAITFHSEGRAVGAVRDYRAVAGLVEGA